MTNNALDTKTLRAAARRLGYKVDIRRGRDRLGDPIGEIVIAPPARHTVGGTDSHEVVAEWAVADGSTEQDAIRAALEDIKLAPEPCTADDCEWCDGCDDDEED